MGLFETKKKRLGEEFGSAVPVNNDAQPTTAPPATPATPGVAPVGAAPLLEFGVDKAIELMRKLPEDNVELVVQVVKTTLESIRVKVSAIIEDAEKKEARIEDNVFNLKREISELEQDIASRRAKIEALQADYAETRKVKERLSLAEYGMMTDVLLEPVESPESLEAPVATSAG